MVKVNNEEEFDMGVFGTDEDVQLNLDETTKLESEKEKEDSEKKEDSEENNNNTNENNTNTSKDEEEESSEDVVSKEKDEEGNSDEDTSPDIFTSFATLLSEKGLLSSFNKETKLESEEDLANLVKSEIDSKSKEMIVSKLGEEGFEALEKGVSLSEYQSYKTDLETLDSVNDETLENNQDLSKRIILEDYKAQGLPEERAIKLLNKSVALGEESLLDDAKESLDSLKEYQKVQFEKTQEQRIAERNQALQEQEKIDNDLKNSVYNTEEIINGVKINKEIKDRMYDTMTSIVSKNENGVPENQLMKDRREDPINFDTKLYYLYTLTKGFNDFSKLMNTTTSKVTSDFENALRSNSKFENSGSPDFLNDADSYDGIGEELNM
jgi:hypothetical protein